MDLRMENVQMQRSQWQRQEDESAAHHGGMQGERTDRCQTEQAAKLPRAHHADRANAKRHSVDQHDEGG